MFNSEIWRDLICPGCEKALILADENASSRIANRDRSLLCRSCGNNYPVIDGVPYFVGQLREQKKTSVSFGFQWRSFYKGRFDSNDVYGLPFSETTDYFLKSVGRTRADLKGARVLDAGTGSGRVAINVGTMGCHVCAVDIHEGLGEVAKRMNNVGSISVFQADLFHLPFKDGYFDIVWSSGVLHHTPDTQRAFQSIARKVKPGGRLFVWLYGKELNHYRLFRHLLPFAHYFPPVLNYIISCILAVPLYIAFNGVFVLVRTKNQENHPRKILGFSVENIAYKSYSSILLNLFDQLHPRFQHEHSVDEVREWFVRNGFHEIVVTESSNVAIRGIKKR